MNRRIVRQFLIALIGIAVLPATLSAAPLVSLQILARLDGTDNAFSNIITSPTVGQEYDWIVVATLAPAGTTNTNLPTDTNGKQQIGSWRSDTASPPNTDGLGAVLYSMFESPTATTQVSFQATGYLGPGGTNSIDPNIYTGLKTKNANSNIINGNAQFTGGVNTTSYSYTVSPGLISPQKTLLPTGITQAASGFALFQNFGAGTGKNGGVANHRSGTNTNNDLTGVVAISAPGTYAGVDPLAVNTTGTNQTPYTMILQSGSFVGGAVYGNQAVNGINGDPNGNDSTFKITSVGSGTSTLSMDAYDMNPGNPGGAFTAAQGFLNIEYHDTAGAQVKPGVSGVLPYSAQTSADPLVTFTGLTIVGSSGGSNDSVLTFNPTTVPFGRVIQNQTPSVNATINNAGTLAGGYTLTPSNNGISATSPGTANAGNNTVAVSLVANANGSATLGNGSYTLALANTSNTGDTSTTSKTLTLTSDIVQNRVITASAINVGRFLISATQTSTITGAGADNMNTMPSVNAVNFSPATGLNFNTGAGGILNAANTTRTLTVGFTTAGPVSTTINLNATSTSMFTKEGLTGEAINSGNAINLAITANPVNLRTFNVASLFSGSIVGAGPISIPFTFTSTGDLATTTSAIANSGGGTINGVGGTGASGFSTSGSYTFNGAAVSVGNITFNAGTDTYTGSGTISGTLTAGQTVTGSITLPVTTLETGLNDTYPSVVVNFSATSTTAANNSILTFNPTTVPFGRVIQGQTPSVNATINNAGTVAGNYTLTPANNGISATSPGSAAVGNNTVAVSLVNNANGSATLGNGSYTLALANTSNTGDTVTTSKTLTLTSDIVQNRPITATAISVGRILVNSTQTSTINAPGVDTSNTTPSVNTVNFSPATGLNFNSGGGLLNNASSSRTLTVGFTAAGPVSTTINLNATSTAMFTKEGLTGEAINSGNAINLAITANPVNLRTFNVASLFSGSIVGAGPISIPFSFTSTGDLATTTSAIANSGGGTINGVGGTGASGFSTSGSYTFNGAAVSVGNITFNAGTDTYTGSGTISGTLTAGQTVTGSITLPVTTLETGLNDTYPSVVVNFSATSTTSTGPSTLTFNPSTASFGNVLGGSTPSVNVTLNNAGTGSGNFTGVSNNNGISGPASGTAAVGNNTLAIQLQANANGSNTLNAAASYTYTVTNTSNSGDTATPKTVTITANIAAATANNTNSSTTFGPALTGPVAAGGSYTGLFSTVVGTTGTGGAPVEHTTATIMAGTNTGSNTVNVSESWRTRDLNETRATEGGNPTSPPLPPIKTTLISDVVNLTRTDSVTQATPTTPYALDMTFNPASLGNPSTAILNAMVAHGFLYLAWLDPNGGGTGVTEWDNAIVGNTGTNNATAAQQGFIGSFAAFQAANGTTLSNYLGAWGVDTTNDHAWAVINHNSAFGVMPEPSTLALAACGLLGLWGVRRRVRK